MIEAVLLILCATYVTGTIT